MRVCVKSIQSFGLSVFGTETDARMAFLRSDSLGGDISSALVRKTRNVKSPCASVKKATLLSSSSPPSRG